MNMVGHHHPVIQQILFAMKVPQRPGYHVRDLRSAQMAGTDILIEIPFQLSAEIAMNFFGLIRICICGQAPKGLGAFAFKPEQHFLG